MLFNSLHFFIFFPIVCALYFSLPYRFRWMLLLAASYYFYMCWNPAYIILILYSTTNDYFAGLMMERSKTRRARMSWLGVSLCANLGMLFFFKYYNFARASLLPILQYANVDFTIPESSFLLPVGISFYTFQSLSYTIDVYRGKIHAERHPGIFAV
jgi:D-alanyl-lipoteichoic acid acyltransferase DltB (MBOAT superfamily)